MAELKTKQHNGDVYAFIDSFVDQEQKKTDSYELIKLMEAITGCPPKMWGPSIIGFGKYYYKSERSSQKGEWPLIGFSPRKAEISLYVFTGLEEHDYLLKDLGKFKKGKACIYIKKLSDINTDALKHLITTTIDYMSTHYTVLEGKL